ncbi:methyltransferase domain-containing protein [Reinekea marina]|uniref:Class I SAM-dependent methyltransferase n=1 Tax=Reinekea marina TaxID=1310421 RepID=A0ABV7WQU2_9GAMM|nr:class I SAM-dependent methyltransferase [Reinekea marina]MDN3647902.1 methyltransferase domain-containing protein [Reinekea marina]
MSKKNDRALRFYDEVLGLDRLHYGLWLPDDDLTFEKLKLAQIRYEDYLVEKLPSTVKSVLDVGCGTGILVKKLLDQSYLAEGLSPDINQKKRFEEALNAPFHHMPFEELSIEDTFDCIIMSESCQYIKLDKLFKNAKRALKAHGYLMICDYFVLNNAEGELSKSGHRYDEFMNRIDQEGFSVVVEEDLTQDVTKTLDLGKDFVEKSMKALSIGTERIRSKHPQLSKFVLWLFKNKIAKATKQTDLLDSDKFKQYKSYRFILLQANS